MEAFFFENTVGLALGALAVVMILGVAWHQRRTRAALRNWVIGGAVCVVLLVVQKLVVTDREAVDAVFRELVAAVDEGRPAAMVALIDERYTADGLTKAELVPRIEGMLDRVEIDRPILRGVEIDVAGDTGDVRFTVICRVRVRGFEGPSQSRWHLVFVRREEGWKVQAIRPLKIDGHEVGSISELRW